MSGLLRPWVPLRETFGEEAIRQSIEAFEAAHPVEDSGVDFAECISADVAETYRRLHADARVMRQLSGLRLDELDIEMVCRRAAQIPSEWRDEGNEPWQQAQRRRSGLSRQLRACAASVANDLELGGFWLEVGALGFSRSPFHPIDFEGLPQVPGQAMAFADLVHLVASLLEAEQNSADRESRPLRAIAFQRYVLRALFDLLVFYCPPPRRAPNQLVEMLASVVLQKAIKPGTMTRLRKQERKGYYRDPK